jgi:acetyl-CoA carboxylase biotin carboxyl carrier protein
VVEAADGQDVHVESGDFRLHLSRDAAVPEMPRGRTARAPAASPAPHLQTPVASAASSQRPAVAGALPEGVVCVAAPMVGTFYRAPAPGATPFVEPGDRVTADDTVCLVEVMKLFNSVKAGVAGTVESILVENGGLVQHGQPLMLIRSVENQGAI